MKRDEENNIYLPRFPFFLHAQVETKQKNWKKSKSHLPFIPPLPNAAGSLDRRIPADSQKGTKLNVDTLRSHLPKHYSFEKGEQKV